MSSVAEIVGDHRIGIGADLVETVTRIAGEVVARSFTSVTEGAAGLGLLLTDSSIFVVARLQERE